MQVQNDVLFTTFAALLIPFAVAILLAVCEKVGFIWAKVNQPTIAAIVGAVLGVIYHIERIYATLNGKPPVETLGTFMLAGIMAGLAGSGLKSWAKDIRSGAITATSEEDIFNMREKLRANGGIGS